MEEIKNYVVASCRSITPELIELLKGKNGKTIDIVKACLNESREKSLKIKVNDYSKISIFDIDVMREINESLKEVNISERVESVSFFTNEDLSDKDSNYIGRHPMSFRE